MQYPPTKSVIKNAYDSFCSILSILCISLSLLSNAFIQQTLQTSCTKLSITRNADNNRRHALETLFFGGIRVIGSVVLLQELSATYPAHVAREKD